MKGGGDDMEEANLLLDKIKISVGTFMLFSIAGGYVFFGLIKHFILKYFESVERKTEAAFKRIDETRENIKELKNETNAHIEKLFNRTDNHEEVKTLIEYCNGKNKGKK